MVFSIIATYHKKIKKLNCTLVDLIGLLIMTILFSWGFCWLASILLRFFVNQTTNKCMRVTLSAKTTAMLEVTFILKLKSYNFVQYSYDLNLHSDSKAGYDVVSKTFLINYLWWAGVWIPQSSFYSILIPV